MASTQKRAATTKSGTRTTRTRSTKNLTSPAPKRQSKQEKRRKQQQRRQVYAVILLAMSLFVILGMFGVQAIFIDLLCWTIKGFVGYGFLLSAPVFIVTAILLFSRDNLGEKMRIWCAFLMPVFLGGLLHTLLSKHTYAPTISAVYTLWTDGLHLESGGVLSGTLAVLFIQLFSNIGAVLIFLLLILVGFFVTLRMTPGELVALIRQAYENRYEYVEYDDDEYDDYDDLERTPRDWKATFEKLSGENGIFAFLSRKKRKQKPKTVKQDVKMPLQERELPMETTPRNATVTPPAEPVWDPPVKAEKSVVTPPPVVESFVTEVTPPEPIRLPWESEEAKELSAQQKKEFAREVQAAVARDITQGLEVPHDDYQYPELSLLKEGGGASVGAVQSELSSIQKRLSETIRSFGIEAKIVGSVRGPSVTRYEVELEQGVRLNKLTNLADDIALSLGASSVRIAPVPGKISLVGIEVPNQQITPVWIREVLASPTFCDHKSKVSFSVGKDIGGNHIIGDIAKLPHLLIAGTTGSGKSVCTNSLIISLLYKSTPEEVRLIMVDPKMVELGIYNGIPHLLIPVVTDPKKAAGALQWAVAEMMKRYRAFSEAGVRDLASFNAYAEKMGTVQKMPQIVVVIDELADLMLVAAKEVEESICRVAQMGRASGMHLIIATQRPSADVITGLMKANIPSRIAFAVASSLESRIILDTQGAEKLVGKGDMLWFPLGSGKPLRVQGCLISDEEVASVVDFVKRSGTADYDEEVLQQIEHHVEEQERGGRKGISNTQDGGELEDSDELLPAAVDIVLEMGQASVSMLQRRLKLGYSRAARVVDQMEERGIVGPFEGSKPRPLLITKEQWQEMQGIKTGATQPVEPPLLPHSDIPDVLEPSE